VRPNWLVGANNRPEALVVMTASPNEDHASAEHKIRELTKELSDARSELAESRKRQTGPEILSDLKVPI